MTQVDEFLADTGPTVADYKRDRWDRPLVVPANGGDPKPYTRSSSAAKAIEDTFGLEIWARRNVAYGLAHDSSLVARILAIGGSPHSWTSEEKKAAGQVVTAAEQVAQAHKGADIGTAVHRLTERLDLGEDVQAGPYQADLDAYRQALTAGGFTTDQRWVEVRMVCDELEMAGTADRIVVGPDGRHYIADLKTGSSVDYGGLGYAAQLAAYANGEIYDPATDTRPGTPDLDRARGLIIHLPAGTGTCTLYWVDLEHGYKAAQLANAVRAARKASKQWLTRCESAEVLVAEPPEVIAAASAMLRARLAGAVEAGLVSVAWPIEVPTFKAGGPRTWVEVKAVEDAIVQAAAAARLPFDDHPPLPDQVPAGVDGLTGTPPNATPGEPEGPGRSPKLTPDQVAPLADIIRTLPLDLKADVVRQLGERGIPGHSERWSVDHLDALYEVLSVADAAAIARRGAVDGLFSGPDDELRPLFTALAGATDPCLLTGLEVEAVEALVAGAAVGPLRIVVEQDGAMRAVCSESELVAALGSKSAVLTAAKAIREARGLAKPRSAADVAADPVLAALAWATTTNQPARSTQP